MSYSYINTLISDTEENFELKSLFEDIDKTIEMLEEEAPVSPQMNSVSNNINYIKIEKLKKEKNENNLKKLQNMETNPDYIQTYIKPNSLGPKYVLVEVERFRNMTPEECAKFTDDPMIARRALPASTQNIRKEDVGVADNILKFGRIGLSFLVMPFSYGIANRILDFVIVNLGKAWAFTGPYRIWFLIASAFGAVLVFLTKILKRFLKKTNKNITVSKIANESVYLTIVDEDNDIPFKKYFEILEESATNYDSDNINKFFNTNFDRVEDACKTIEKVPEDGKVGKLRLAVEKLAGIVNYCTIKAKASLSKISNK